MLGSIRRLPAIAALAAFAAAAAACGRSNADFPYSGTILRESAALGSTVGGRVVAVAVTSGQRVRAGQILVRFDDAQLRAALFAAHARERAADAALADLVAGPRASDIARADAQAAQALAAYDLARLAGGPQSSAADAQVRASQAALARAQADAGLADRTARRQRQLYVAGAVALQNVDNADAAARAAAAAAGAARAQLSAARAQAATIGNADVPQGIRSALQAYRAADAQAATVRAGTRPGQIDAARAAALAARSDAAAAGARLAECTIRAPADGVVSALDLHPGDMVAPGAVAVTLDEFRDPYVRIFVRQADLGRFRTGAKVRVRADASAGTTFDGVVEQIDANAQFTPRDVQTPEDRADVSFGAKIRIHDPGAALHGGTTASVAMP